VEVLALPAPERKDSAEVLALPAPERKGQCAACSRARPDIESLGEALTVRA